jgi:hypothetical protein
MLSKTDDKKPSPKAVCQDAIGNFSTGIIEAHNTRESKKMEPFSASGTTSQSGRRTATVKRIATQTAMPMKGKRSAR